MQNGSILIIGSGHLAYRIKKLASDQNYNVTYFPGSSFDLRVHENSMFDAIKQVLGDVDLS